MSRKSCSSLWRTCFSRAGTRCPHQCREIGGIPIISPVCGGGIADENLPVEVREGGVGLGTRDSGGGGEGIPTLFRGRC